MLLTTNIYQISGIWGTGIWGANVFLLVGNNLTLVDTGFAEEAAPAALLQWMVFIHDVAFIVTGTMLFVHIYFSVVHPLMRPLRTGAWSSMARGRVSDEYARSHHAKWYEEVTKVKEVQSK